MIYPDDNTGLSDLNKSSARKLSKVVLTGIVSLICMVTATPVFAGEAFPGLGDPRTRNSPLWLKLTGGLCGESGIDGQNAESKTWIGGVKLGARLWSSISENMMKPPVRNSEGAPRTDGPPAIRGKKPPGNFKGFGGIKKLSAVFSYENRRFGDGVLLPDTLDDIPPRFYDVKTSVTYSQVSSRRKLWGISASFGSASDEPFASSDLATTEAFFFLTNPVGKRDSWMFLLYYSNNRAVLNHIPLPGVAYFWKPNENLKVLAGIPFLFANWKVTDLFNMELTVNIAPGGRFKTKYSVSDKMEVFAGLDMKSESYIREARTDKWDRLFFYESSLHAGATFTLGKTFEFEVKGGRKFDRYIFEGEGYEDRDENRIDLENCFFAAVALSLWF